MDVGVVEPRQDAASAQVDPVRTGERGLVGADPPGDPVTGNGQCARDRQRRLHRPDHTVLEDHTLSLSSPSSVSSTMNTLVILLPLVVMLAVASYWPRSE